MIQTTKPAGWPGEKKRPSSSNTSQPWQKENPAEGGGWGVYLGGGKEGHLRRL